MQEIFGIIYKTTNLINGKVYIGQTIKKLSERKTKHYYDAKNNNTYFSRALIKYGFENFGWEIIDCAELDSDELNYLEEYWIKFYNSNDARCGYNLTKGGSGCSGYKFEFSFNNEFNNSNCNKALIIDEILPLLKEDLTFTEIAKKLKTEKRSIERRLKWFDKDLYREYKEKQKILYFSKNKGKNHTNYIDICDIELKEIKQKIIDNNYKTKEVFEEYPYRKEIIFERLRDKYPNFWRKILSNLSKGENNSFYGKTHSKETKNKISEKNSKYISEETFLAIKKDIELDIKLKGRTNFSKLSKKYSINEKTLKRRIQKKYPDILEVK